MVNFGDEQVTQCVVFDQHPNSEQKKISIIVRAQNTVGKVLNDIATQYPYENFDLVLQPFTKGDSVFLNDIPTSVMYKVPGFQPYNRNTLILLPPGQWDGDVKKRIDLWGPPIKSTILNGSASTITTKTATITTTKTATTTTTTTQNNNLNINHSNSSNNNMIISNNDTPAPALASASASTTASASASVSASASATASSSSNNNVVLSSPVSAAMMVDGESAVYSGSIDTSTTISVDLSPMSDHDHDQMFYDDLALGASASPTEFESMNGGGGPLALANTSPSSMGVKFGPVNEDDLYQQYCAKKFTEEKNLAISAMPSTSTATPSNAYVGLVNQAMTCYLNSLLQALYMTPEFRNALYRWEFDNDNEAKNIPYQLQKLFLNLQTSKKSAVETTDLTRSFGWDSTEAWQQHDIQELCRVMFDALEHKFKNTQQANLISTLYEGQMIDYVKCLECNTEKTRSDMFLDIPLPVRPFGSTVAYGSIEEALCAFVQPETLDGNNQYFCEKCNKKCDAHKGLKFKNFPYILTLHLKRFDFDYQTMHRIKLNDQVTFPQTLNLNSFVNATDAQTFANLPQANGVNVHASNGYNVTGNTVTNLDDCSTADSGSAMEEDNCSSGIATTASSSQHENDMNDEDEGIDMSTSTDHRTSNGVNVEQRIKHESGPFIYELFAIMIHSGSASGGHYYAYIKEFENNEWFSFNDQTVSPITQEDIQRSFGGSSIKPYYTSVYSSSTNAYMLMYRQIDPKRNEHAMKMTDVPPHINGLLPKLQADEESRVSRGGRHNAVSDMIMPEFVKPHVYFYNPDLKKLKVTRVYAAANFPVNLVLESAYNMLNVEKFAPISRCRLVAYNHSTETIQHSFENPNEIIKSDPNFFAPAMDFLLEYSADGQELEVYKPGGATWNVYMVNLSKMEMDGPFLVCSPSGENDEVLRHSIAVRLHVCENQLLVATRSNKAFVAYHPNPTKEAQEHLKAVVKSQFYSLTYVYLYVPNTDANSLEVLGIPPYETQTPTIAVSDSSDVVDAVALNGPTTAATAATTTPISDSSSNSCLSAKDGTRSDSPMPPDSNSEDSSLSDCDRTLVYESTPQQNGLATDGIADDSQLSSSSHSLQLSSPEDEAHTNTDYRLYDRFLNDGNEYTSSLHNSGMMRFFHATKIDCSDSAIAVSRIETNNDGAGDGVSHKPTTAYKIIVDSLMKMGAFKKHIETLIRVPCNYFQIQRKQDSSETMDPNNTVLLLIEGEPLLIELGKVLQKDEQKAKVSFLRLSELNDDSGKLPHICDWVYNTSMTAGEVKVKLVAQLRRLDAKYDSLKAENCRLWLKGGRNPIKIFDSDEVMGSDMSPDLLIQECEDGVDPKTTDETVTIFVRRWHPDQLKLDRFQEITLDKNSEIRNVLAKLSGLPEEHIGYVRINGSFPCTNISVLAIEYMNWITTPATLDQYPLTTTINGSVYFYQDVRTVGRELSPQERRDLNAKESARIDRLTLGGSGSSLTMASPRRERALKIYLDSSPETTTTNTSTTLTPTNTITTSASASTSTSTNATDATLTPTTAASAELATITSSPTSDTTSTTTTTTNTATTTTNATSTTPTTTAKATAPTKTVTKSKTKVKAKPKVTN